MTDRQSLVLAHAWVVDWAARRSGRRMEAMEARQEGWLALVGAAAEWDGQGRFDRFAAPRVRAAIRNARRRQGRLWEGREAIEHLDELAEERPTGFDVETESAVRAAMGEALDQDERDAIRRHWIAGERCGGERERRTRRRAEQKLRRHLAG